MLAAIWNFTQNSWDKLSTLALLFCCNDVGRVQTDIEYTSYMWVRGEPFVHCIPCKVVQK